MTAATTIVRQPALASSPQPTPTARALIAQCTKGARPRRWGEVHMKTWMPLRASRRERADCGPKRRAIARLALGAGCQHVQTFCVSVRRLLEMLRQTRYALGLRDLSETKSAPTRLPGRSASAGERIQCWRLERGTRSDFLEESLIIYDASGPVRAR